MQDLFQLPLWTKQITSTEISIHPFQAKYSMQIFTLIYMKRMHFYYQIQFTEVSVGVLIVINAI